jgi:hypothetical protein
VQWVDFAPVRAVLQEIEVEEPIEAAPIVVIRRADLPLTPAAEFLCDLLRRAALPRKRTATRKRAVD